MNKSDNPKKEKLRKVLFSLLILCLIVVTSITGYAAITGRIPNVLTSLNHIFSVPSAGGKQLIKSPLDLHMVNSEDINPSEIGPSDTTSPSTSSTNTSSVDPDAKIIDGQQKDPYYSTDPVPVTASQGATSTSSNPASGSSSSKPVSSASSEPVSSAPPVSSSPGPDSSGSSSSSSSTSSSHSGGGGGNKSHSITSVALDKADMTLNKGDISPALVAAIFPTNATGSKTITWTTDNPAIVTIDSSGRVTAVGAGKTQINATTINGKIASCTVTVLVPPSSIKIDSDNFSLDRGSSITLKATVEPEDCTDKSVQWATSNNDVATVDADGKVTALTSGEATITATTANGKLSDSVAVNGVISISKLTLNKTETSLIKGTTEALTATIDPPDTTEEKTLQWTPTDPSIATVDSSGTITAVARGTTVITAQVGSHVAECTVTVTVPASGIVVNKTTAKLEKGTDETLIATIFPEDASDKTVKWSSSDPAIVTVDDFGKVTAISVGTATITAATHDGAYTANCAATVVIPVTGVTLDKSTLGLIKGDNATLTATIEPLDATDQAITWESSDPSIVTVDSSGHVTAVGGGTADLKVTTHDGGFTATCSVTVTVPASGITLDKAALTLVKGTNGALAATITPADASNKNVLWSSTDSNVCGVDASGSLTAVGTGTATITATSEDGGHTASCTVTVVIPVTGVTLNKTALNLIKGNSNTLTANIAPVDATDQAVTWESSDPSVATVDSSGRITAVGGGTATIKVTTHDGGFAASCNVTVTVPVSRITLNKSSTQLYIGERDTLIATISPADATDQAVTWESSDPSVATVDNSGHVKAVGGGMGDGTATIKVTTHDGAYAASCTVAVFCKGWAFVDGNGSVSFNGQQLSGPGFGIRAGSNVTLTAVPNAHYHFVNWTDAANNVVGTSNTYSIDRTQSDVIVTANFAIDTYVVTLNTGMGGTVSGGGVYPYGSNVRISAAPSGGNSFSKWSDGSTDASRYITVNDNITLSAGFRGFLYNPTVTRSDGDCSAYESSTASALRLTLSGFLDHSTKYYNATITFQVDPNAVYPSTGTGLIKFGGSMNRYQENTNVGGSSGLNQLTVTYAGGAWNRKEITSYAGWTSLQDLTFNDSRHVQSISINMGIRCSSSSQNYLETIEIPWSCFTWLPTGQTFSYIPES